MVAPTLTRLWGTPALRRNSANKFSSGKPSCKKTLKRARLAVGEDVAADEIMYLAPDCSSTTAGEAASGRRDVTVERGEVNFPDLVCTKTNADGSSSSVNTPWEASREINFPPKSPKTDRRAPQAEEEDADARGEQATSRGEDRPLQCKGILEKLIKY
jgi:hypothetical protein